MKTFKNERNNEKLAKYDGFLLFFDFYNVIIKTQQDGRADNMKNLKANIKKKVNDTNKKNRFKFKTCGSITCIHNMGERCNLESCEMYERNFMQEY
ncbi:hypothetical protein PV797_21055 [Clostridiaceae bacterium M8S5]|nr:hypothetical protein PV797_21055 [Clostridiaceae bacterium M8S5]